jgi:hypothetical protein
MTVINRAAAQMRMERCLRLHYRLMARRNFWYSVVLKERSKKLCVEASNLRPSLTERQA